MKVLVNAMSARVLGIECPSKPHVSCPRETKEPVVGRHPGKRLGKPLNIETTVSSCPRVASWIP